MNPSSETPASPAAPSAAAAPAPASAPDGILASEDVLPIDPPPSPVDRRCENCGTPLLGEHCYACGQPTRGMVRHFTTIVGDVVDTVFNFDSRTVRTIGPLLFRPGRLTHEYFDGHRVRFVSPVRLFFFFCVAAFLALQFSVDTGDNFVNFNGAGDISTAPTVQEAETRRDAAIALLETTRKAIPTPPDGDDGMDEGIAEIRREAETRLAYLRARDAAIAAGTAPPEDPNAEEEPIKFRFNERDWDPDDNPLVIGWLPTFANDGINRLLLRARGNIDHIRDDPGRLLEAFLQTLPQTLFVLLPVFALLLKLMYVFKRRLYMEHLIVALHSHAFLCAALLLMVLLTDIGAQFAAGGLVESVCELAVFVLMLWMPLYLLLMQKRVYRQGWIMTLLKYFVIGNLYLILISFGVVVNLAFSLVSM